MLKRLTFFALIGATIGFSSCSKDADKEKPFLITALNTAPSTYYFEWDGVSGEQHTIVVYSDTDQEQYEVGLPALYEGHDDISKYTFTIKNWSATRGGIYKAKVVANYSDGDNVDSNEKVLGEIIP